MATDYTPYEGRRVRGWPTTVLVGGHVVVEGSRVVDDTARGRHLPAAPLR
jgi:dihydropyrimidinase